MLEFERNKDREHKIFFIYWVTEIILHHNPLLLLFFFCFFFVFFIKEDIFFRGSKERMLDFF